MNFNYTSLKNYNQDVGRSRLYCKFYLGVLVYLIVLYASGIISPADTFHKLRSSSSTGPIQYFAVWSYPFPPPKVELDDEERLYCSYSPCAPTNEDLNFYKAPYIINLRQLVSPKVSRPFDEFIQHHMWWKFVHGNNFPHHVQSVAILSLLMTRRRACVRTLGRDRSEVRFNDGSFSLIQIMMFSASTKSAVFLQITQSFWFLGQFHRLFAQVTWRHIIIMTQQTSILFLLFQCSI